MIICTFLWQSTDSRQYAFPTWTVRALRDMVARHVTLPHRFVCICDEASAEGVRAEGVEVYPLWPRPPIVRRDGLTFDCFVRLGMLGSPGADLGRHYGEQSFLWIDLDVVIRSNIDDLVMDAEREPLKVYWSRPWSPAVFNGMARGYNGALVGGRLGGSPDIWQAANDQAVVDKACSSYIGSDQAILTHMRPRGTLPFWSPADGITLRGEAPPRGDWRVTFTTSGNTPWVRQELASEYEQQTGLTIPRRYRKGGPAFLRRRSMPGPQA